MLVLVEARAAVQLNAQAALGDAVHHAMRVHHRTIDHELHEAVGLLQLHRLLLLVEFQRDHAGQSVAQQPGMKLVDLAPAGCVVGQQGQQDVQRVEHDAARAHLRDLLVRHGQKPAKVEIAGTRSGAGWASMKNSVPPASESSRHQPKLDALAMSRFESSSKETKMPGFPPS